jgi:hypothetical protein
VGGQCARRHKDEFCRLELHAPGAAADVSALRGAGLIRSSSAAKLGVHDHAHAVAQALPALRLDLSPKVFRSYAKSAFRHHACELMGPLHVSNQQLRPNWVKSLLADCRSRTGNVTI